MSVVGKSHGQKDPVATFFHLFDEKMYLGVPDRIEVFQGPRRDIFFDRSPEEHFSRFSTKPKKSCYGDPRKNEFLLGTP